MKHVHRKRMSKEKNQRYHAKIRMLQHYGKQITNYDLDRMAEVYLYTNNRVILFKQSNRVRKALIWYQNEVYPIIFDRNRRQIVTVLKVDYLTPKQLEIYHQFKSRMETGVTEIHNPVISNDVIFETNDDVEDTVETSPIETENPIEEETEEEMNQRLMREAVERMPN